jgi:transcriptional regulator with XRE-family HTH domain
MLNHLSTESWELQELPQAALAARVGVHRIYVAQIEGGTKTPSLPTLHKLAKPLAYR